MEFPTILAGPILRRVEPSHIYIWLATSKEYLLSAKLFTIQTNKESKDYNQIHVRVNQKTVKTGDHLFINLIKVTPFYGGFPVEQLLGYNITFKNSEKAFDLHDLELLNQENPDSIVYRDFQYPTFFIQSEINPYILYGSCRKLHGKGPDRLAEADHLLAETSHDLSQRPSALFMLGDQIYADDVADPIFPFIYNISRRLIGEQHENLVAVEPKLKEQKRKKQLEKVRGRQDIMNNLCQFTSSNAHNHLITLGEYAVMYLLSWSPELWNLAHGEKAVKSFNDVYERNQIHFTSQKSSDDEHNKEYIENKKRYAEQLNDLQAFEKSISRVRRVLANTPTYMMFDDHDLTDDWNLSSQWKEDVYDSPLGKHTIANGLSAYWLFQGWGNQPAVYDGAFIQTHTAYFKNYRVRATSYVNWMLQLFSFQSWHFVAPTTPASLFLDTRTLREYDASLEEVKLLSFVDEVSKPPILIGEKGWSLVDSLLSKAQWETGEPLIIASATPLYGVQLIERFLQNNIYPFRALGVPVHYKLDFEAWKYNMKGFSSFLQQLKKWQPSDTIILSGDVHYAFTAKANVEINNHDLSIYQLTSSPMNNDSFGGVFGSLLNLIVWINTLQGKGRKVSNHNLNSNSLQNNHLSWTEDISYQSIEDSSILVTNNNLGILNFSGNKIQSKLLLDTVVKPFGEQPLNEDI